MQQKRIYDAAAVTWALYGESHYTAGARMCDHFRDHPRKRAAVTSFVEFSLFPHLVGQLPTASSLKVQRDRRNALDFLAAEMHRLFILFDDWPEKERLA